MSSSLSPSAVDDRGGPAAANGVWWRLPLLLAAVLAAIVLARVSQQQDRTVAPAALPAAVPGKRVSLVIDFGDGRERKFESVPWRPEMTVDQLMTDVSRQSNGITFAVAGHGEMMMLEAIDRQYNNWPGGSAWYYEVNGQLADRSMGIYPLQPGDRVLWSFRKRQ